jgi:hypothetical protein
MRTGEKAATARLKQAKLGVALVRPAAEDSEEESVSYA